MTLLDVVVEEDISGNGYNVSVTFFLLNLEEPVEVSMFLERLR